MTKPIWSKASQDDLEAIADYISKDNPDAADRILDKIENTVNSLARMPVGRKGRMFETYEKVVSGLPYIIAYKIDGNDLTVVRVIHGAIDWQPGTWPEE